MSSWSIEAIIALITLSVTLIPIGLVLWRAVDQRRGRNGNMEPTSIGRSKLTGKQVILRSGPDADV